MLNKYPNKIRLKVIGQLIDTLDRFVGCEIYLADLHFYAFNEDYSFSYTSDAKEFLDEFGVWDAINKVQEYEDDMFGEVVTELGDPFKVANMLMYILGEELIYELGDYAEKRLTDELIEQYRERLTEVWDGIESI